ncbi:hypothetical protein ACFFGH_09385 [Lysobacter korlensis]|uniref:Small CPxCG-related zinc finger protein n=1 Tax=Lysobacter korlensis TaxID=553636 RepID=A0ABV6RNB6_9GAMM
MDNEQAWSGARCAECGRELEVEPIAAEAVEGSAHLTMVYICPVHGPVSLTDPD